MKVKFDITAGLEKMTVFKELEGKANIDAHFEVEFGADELSMMYQFQKEMVPQILDFIKEVKKENEDSEKEILEKKVSQLEFENARLNGKLEHAEERLSNRDKWFNKAMESLGGKKEEEEDDDELY